MKSSILCILLSVHRAVVVAQTPCVVCGEGKVVTKPDVIWQLPGQPAVQCGLLETAGSQGLIPDNFCGIIPDLIVIECGCSSLGGGGGGTTTTTTPANNENSSTGGGSNDNSNNNNDVPTSSPVSPTPTFYIDPQNTYDVIKTVDSFTPSSQSAEYSCVFYNNYERDGRGHMMGADNVYWAAPILYSHAAGESLWRVGEQASQAVEQFVETGNKRNFIKALQNHSDSFDAAYDKYLFAYDSTIVFDPITVNNYKRYLSSITRFNPSPDWFSGFYDFDCINPETDSWYKEFELRTYLFDGGTEEGDGFSNFNKETKPVQPITQILEEDLSDKMKEEFLSEDETSIPPLITFHCKLVGDDGGMGATQSPIFAVLTQAPKPTTPPNEQTNIFATDDESKKAKKGSGGGGGGSSVGMIIGVVVGVCVVIVVAFLFVRRRRRKAREQEEEANNPYPKNSSYRSGSIRNSKKKKGDVANGKSYEMKLKGKEESTSTMNNTTNTRSGFTSVGTIEKDSVVSKDSSVVSTDKIL